MKKYICLLLCLLLPCALSVSAFASQLLPGFSGSPWTQKEAQIFEDTAAGTTLSVPADWEIRPVEGDAVAKSEFICPQEPSAVIRYGSTDMWSTLSDNLQQKISREEFDNGLYTAEEIAKLIGTKETYVNTLELADMTYFRAEVGKRRLFSFKVTDTYLIHVRNGWMYVYAFQGSDQHTLYPEFEQLVASAAYSQGTEETSSPPETLDITPPAETAKPAPSKADIYKEAVEAYYRMDHWTAQELFESVSNYEDSQKYLRLIRIRQAGANVGVGSVVYNSAYGLTDQNKRDIDAAARDFYFADTSEVLLCNSDVACYYLVGDWNGGSKCYIHFKMNNYGGTYNIGSKLSTNYQSTFSIENGILRVDVINTNKKTLELTLLSPDCMQVITYEKNNNCYTLNRQ